MKLSKNRLNKIKLKRNASRKKYNLRRKKSAHENTNKKNRRNPHLKSKTLKIYRKHVGGRDDENKTSGVNEIRVATDKPDKAETTPEPKVEVEANKNAQANTNTEINTEAQSANTSSSLNTISESLKQYECDPSKIDTNVPSDIEEAERKYHKIDLSLLYCSGENTSAILEKWSQYIDEFEKRFGRFPEEFTISSQCKDLFIGNLNYNQVPDTKILADQKILEYIELEKKDLNTNQGKCHSSIDAALKLYMTNLNQKYPRMEEPDEEPTTDPQEEQQSSTGCSSKDIEIDTLFTDENKNNTCNVANKKKMLLQLHPDKNIGCLKDSTAKFQAFTNKYEELCNESAKSEETGAGTDNDTEDKTVPIAIPKAVPMAVPMAVPTADKNENDNENVNDVDNKSEQPDTKVEPADMEKNTNIEVNLNENDINDNLKRVSVDIVIPRNAEVLVRNYANNNANETLTNIASK